MSLILADSNILVYAINSTSPKHKKAQDFLRQNLSNLCVAHQNILETLRVLTHDKFPYPMPPKAALEAIVAITKNVRILAPDSSAVYIAQELLEQHDLKGDQIFDAYLVSTALAAGVKEIATDNTKHFNKLNAIKTLNPFS